MICMSLAVLLLGTARSIGAQDIFAQHKINALKGLSGVLIVNRPNVQFEVLSPKELSDYLEVAVRRNLPELRVKSTVEESIDWLEFSHVTTNVGAYLQLTIYRWVTVTASKEEVFAPVWSESIGIFGRPNKKHFLETIDGLITSFAADYLRANAR